jgi:hypothetical protein
MQGAEERAGQAEARAGEAERQVEEERTRNENTTFRDFLKLCHSALFGPILNINFVGAGKVDQKREPAGYP